MIYSNQGGERMYNFIKNLLEDKKSDTIFTCFGIYHLIYMFLIFGGIILAIILLKNMGECVKKKAISVTINGAFGLYILDFFLMPFAYGKIDIEKLPFHICTAMCVLCFLSNHTKFFSKFRVQFAFLGLISNIIYVIYPAGVGWYQIHPLSYRVYQTLLFHGLMTAYGLFVLIFEKVKFEWKKCYKDLCVIIAMVLWALLGNTLYNGQLGFFNWFFVVRDPFYIIPENISPYVMPFLVIVSFFIVEMIFYGVYFGIHKIIKKRKTI